jgi:dimeric dUTPase (all-alpha-NTP-PPase superfamily)
MLQEMLDKQNKLQERLGYDIGSMHDEERSAFIKENSIHLTQELHELLYEIPHFKPWKDYSGMSLFDSYESWYKASKELIDMLHFFLNICLALGLNADNLYDMYMAKNKENHKRQDEGYTYDKSYR